MKFDLSIFDVFVAKLVIQRAVWLGNIKKRFDLIVFGCKQINYTVPGAVID